MNRVQRDLLVKALGKFPLKNLKVLRDHMIAGGDVLMSGAIYDDGQL